MEQEKAGRKSLNLSTETVEMLWKSGPVSTCKFGFLLRIWRFAQDFVKALAAARMFFYIIDNKVFVCTRRPAAEARVSPT